LLCSPVTAFLKSYIHEWLIAHNYISVDFLCYHTVLWRWRHTWNLQSDK